MYITHICVKTCNSIMSTCSSPTYTALQVMVSASRQEMVGHLLKVFNT